MSGSDPRKTPHVPTVPVSPMECPKRAAAVDEILARSTQQAVDAAVAVFESRNAEILDPLIDQTLASVVLAVLEPKEVPRRGPK